MATIAQVAAQRRRQVAVVRAALRDADGSGEKFHRKLSAYANKKKLLEPKDMQPLNTLYRDYASKLGAIEKSLTDLNNLVGS